MENEPAHLQSGQGKKMDRRLRGTNVQADSPQTLDGYPVTVNNKHIIKTGKMVSASARGGFVSSFVWWNHSG